MISFLTGVLITTFAFSLFKEKDFDFEEDVQQDLELNDATGRHVTLSCQSCRKLKRHKEIEPGLFECVKCKRRSDVRVS
ncbi:MAG: hypothetical protein LPK00_13840 [Bacillaceae bacterium]|mgnify:CR=1 FL=1|nr:hypothetical protein [Bacillaceae bacterium]